MELAESGWLKAVLLANGVFLGAATSRALQGGNDQKTGEGVSHPIGHVETPNIAEIVSRYRTMRGH